MILVNLVFDDEYDDVDFILVQEEFFENKSKCMREFDDWAHDNENGCFQLFNNKWVCCVNTEELIRWLNEKFMTSKENEAKIIKQHTQYNPDLPIIEL